VPDVLVPGARMQRWLENFAARHGEVTLAADGDLVGTAVDGSTFRAALPFGRRVEGPVSVDAVVAATVPPSAWGVLLVRKGGFAVARLEHDRTVESKVGQRHVQGRTKAGGQSQQRFARRRDNQARQAYEAAADHAARLLGEGTPFLVTGGDHAAVQEVLADPRLRRVDVVPPWLPVPDPKRGVLEQAIRDAASAWVQVDNIGEDQ
jgi:Actinobacteria/chloroflexi VLRF1 release factor